MPSEVRGRSRAMKPIPPTYPNLVQEPWEKNEKTYVLTKAQLDEVIEKYGPPIMKLSQRRGGHYLAGKKGSK